MTTPTSSISGNKALAVVKAQESYECLKTSFASVIEEVNQLVTTGKFAAFERTYDVDIYIGGDYKVLYATTPSLHLKELFLRTIISVNHLNLHIFSFC